MHLYEVVGSREERQKLHASNETERITSFNNRQEYMSLHGPRQEESSEYQQPQQCGKNTKKAENKKGASDSEYHELKHELKQTKICLHVLYLLIVILFLMTASSLGLAAYCFSSIILSSNDLEYRLNTINSEVLSQRIFINKQFNTTDEELVSQRTFINNVELLYNTTNAEITSQRMFINTLNSQLNGIDSDVSTVRSSVSSLQSQLTRILTESSLQITVTNQPSK